MFVLLTLLLILAVMLVLLASPVGLEYFFNNQGQQKQKLQIVWLYGLARFNLKKSTKSERVKKISSTKKINKKQKKKPKRVNGFKLFLTVMQSKGFIKRIFQFLRQLLTEIEVKQLHTYVWFGLDDPADTGRVYGYLSPIISLAHSIPHCNIAVVPVFGGTLLEVEFKTKVQIVPIRIIWLFIQFIFSRETLRACRLAFRAS